MDEDTVMEDAPQDEAMTGVSADDGHATPTAAAIARNELTVESRLTTRTPSPFRRQDPWSPYATPERQTPKGNSPRPSGDFEPAVAADDGHSSPTLATAATNELVVESHPTARTSSPLGQPAGHNTARQRSPADLSRLAISALINANAPQLPATLEPNPQPPNYQPTTAILPPHFAFAPPRLQRHISAPGAPFDDHPSQYPTHAHPHDQAPRSPSIPSTESSGGIDIFAYDWHSLVFDALMTADPERPGFGTEKQISDFVVQRKPELRGEMVDFSEIVAQVEITLQRGKTVFTQEKWKSMEEGWVWGIKGMAEW